MSCRWLLVCALSTLLAACGPEDPTGELRELIETTEEAAEDHKTGFFRELLSARYTDVRGNDRERVIGFIRGYFITHQSIEIVTRIETIELNGIDAAEVSLLAGLLDQRAGAPLLSGFDGRLYDIELEFVEESGDWRLIGARWERSLKSWN